jgi:hypothetical protein
MIGKQCGHNAQMGKLYVYGNTYFYALFDIYMLMMIGILNYLIISISALQS